MILETVSHLACMGPLIHLKAVDDAIRVQNIVQLAGIDSQTILVTHIDRNGAIPAQISDVLIHESEHGIRCPFRENVRLDHTVFCRKV